MIRASELEPLGTWVVVRMDPRKEEKSGLVLPESKLERVREGTGRILAIGEGAKKGLDGFFPEVGDRVCFRSFVKDAYGHCFEKEDGQIVFVLSARDILAVIGGDVEMGAFSG